MKRFISSDELVASYGIPGFRISNHDEVWLALKQHELGEENEDDKSVVFIFLIKIGAMALQKLYPRTASHIFGQNDMLSQMVINLREYYFRDMGDRIFRFFPTHDNLVLIDLKKIDDMTEYNKASKKNEGIIAVRKQFINHFLRKAIFEGKDIISAQMRIEGSEVSYDEWIEIASSSIIDQIDDMEDYYEKRTNKHGEFVDRKVKRDKLVHPDKRKAEGDIPTSPQEQQVIYEESIYEYIKKSQKRKLEGKKISERIDEALARAEWRHDRLFGRHQYNTVRDFYMADPVGFLMCTLLPTANGVVADYTFSVFERRSDINLALYRDQC